MDTNTIIGILLIIAVVIIFAFVNLAIAMRMSDSERAAWSVFKKKEKNTSQRRANYKHNYAVWTAPASKKN